MIGTASAELFEEGSKCCLPRASFQTHGRIYSICHITPLYYGKVKTSFQPFGAITTKTNLQRGKT